MLTGTAESLLQQADPSPETVTKPVRQFIDQYNLILHNVSDDEEVSNRQKPALIDAIKQTADPLALNELGITHNEDGTLRFDETAFWQHITTRSAEVPKSSEALTRLAENVMCSFSGMEQLPAEALFHINKSPLKPYSSYRSGLQTYLPVPFTGLLFDAYL